MWWFEEVGLLSQGDVEVFSLMNGDASHSSQLTLGGHGIAPH